MNATYKGFPEGAEKTVYIRAVAVADLPDEVREEVGAEVGEVETVYSVNGPDGKPLALVADRRMAFDLARNNDFAPVSVH